MKLYRLATFLSRPFVRLLFRPHVTGRQHLPRAGGYVLAANHLSGFDIWAIAYPLYPRAVRNMGKNQLFRRRFLAPLIRSLGAFPAHAEPGQFGGVEAAAAFTAAGEVVVIFPTGARLRLDKEHRPRSGAARSALEAGVPLVPAALRGTDGWRRLERWWIAIGPPIGLDDLADQDPTRAAREATQRLWDAITSLERTLADGAVP